MSQTNAIECSIYDDELSLLSLKELQVLLQSQLIDIKHIQESQVKSQQQLLIYFNQLEKTVPKEQLQKHLHLVCTKLLNDQFKNKKSLQKRASEQAESYEQTIQQNQHEPDNQQLYNDQSRLLGPQIFQQIHQHFPLSFSLIDKTLVSQFNKSHSSDILDLIAIELQGPGNFNSLEPIIYIVQHIVLPITYTHPDFCQKGVEIINTAINYFDQDSNKKTQLINKLSEIVTSLCLSSTHSSNLSVPQIISIMTTVQAIQSKAQSYKSTLVNSKIFHSFIYKMLLCSNVDSKTANSIAVNIYGALLKQLNLYCNQAQIFINLYSTLRCFGAHLVKDMWPLFYDFIEIQGNDLIFTKAKLIDIIFYKIEHHQNANVVKHCIQSILQQQISFILFDRVPDAIFNSLIRILNYGMHYLDCLFHMDSKMFPMISGFFSKYFNDKTICKQQDFERKMGLFLKAIYQKMTFDHALVAMMHSFTLIERQSCVVGKQEIVWISALVRKYYVKYPIRKKHQMMNGVCHLLKNHLHTQKRRTGQTSIKSQNEIDLNDLMNNCLKYFPEEYIMLSHNGLENRTHIYQIIKQNFTIKEINLTLINYTNKINEILKSPIISQESSQELIQTLRLIQLVLYLTEQSQTQQKCQKFGNQFRSLQVETLEQLRQVYCLIFQRFVNDLGNSLYKHKDERLFGINVQKVCLQKIFAMNILIPKLDLSNFIQKTLTNLSLTVKDCIQSESKVFLNKQDIIVCLYIVKQLFEMIYELSREDGIQELQEKVCRSGSQFLEWATDHIEHPECHLLILTALKTRINQSNHSPIPYIEQSVYHIFWALFKLQNNNFSIIDQPQENQQNIFNAKIQQISPLYRLRLLTLCASILFYDDNQVRKFYSHLTNNIEQLADRYDFQNLDEILYLVELIFTCQQTAIDKKTQAQFLGDSSQTYKRICKVINSIIETMLTQLNYGVDSKEVISCSNSILNIMFNFAAKFNHFSPQLITLSIRALQVGQEYWMFERMITFKTIQNLSIMLQRHDKISYKGLFPLLARILSTEQYRGYDSGVVLQKQLTKQEFYTELKLILHKESDYEGTTCRLGFIEFINSLIQYSLTNTQNYQAKNVLDQFLQEFFLFIYAQTKKDTNEKMFLTGQHKTKLKLWQALLAYHPRWMVQSCKNKNNWLKFTIEELIIDIIEVVDKNNNLFEVKYYMELFLMKLMINDQSQKIITQRILNLLSQKLIKLSSEVNKNVSFIFISGSIMNFIFRSYHITKNHPLLESLQKLYNTILIYSCSHVAYFRGLSQFFCLERLFVESEYTKILHQTIGKDSDTVLLKNKLRFIVNDYFDEIKHWNVRNNLFAQLPTLSGNIVSQSFYMDKLKKLGQQLLRQIRSEIGFYPYKQIWLEACKNLKPTNDIVIDIQKDALNINNQEQAIFQRKIDPSLDFIYFSKTKLQGFEMKILITGSKSLPIYGHLSRTGQIFGLSELIIPYKQIVEDEEFKNVACTAEKWLNISWFSNKQEMENRQKFELSLQKELLTKKQEGYAFFLLKKQKEVSEERIRVTIEKVRRRGKILLILDSEDYVKSEAEQLIEGKVCFGEYFSEHVQASIFIWEYFKQIYGKKFRSQTLEAC